MKLELIDVWTRLKTKLNRYIAPGNSNGVIEFGENNDYPQITERLINNSVTAFAAARKLSSFIVGKGFNDIVNNIYVGTEATCKRITVYDLMSKLATDIAYHGGCYVHVAKNPLNEIKQVNYVPFKDCRFEKPDDFGYINSIHVYDNWEKGKKFEKERIRIYPIYNSNYKVFEERLKRFGEANYRGEIDYFFANRQYIYPLSSIDSVFHDVDTEFSMSLYRNNVFRNGMLDKVIIRVSPIADEMERLKLVEKLKQLISADGDPVLLIEDDVDANGNISNTTGLRIDKIESNIKSEMFEKLEPIIENKIRKAFYSIPKTLLDIEESKLGTTSGEAFMAAINYYNAETFEIRTRFGQWLADILMEVDNIELKENNDWTIKPLNV